MRDMQYVHSNAIEGVSPEAFQKQRPYPWVTFQGTLTEPGFERLRETLPDVSLFERHVDKRAFGQGYHDRYLLHYHPGLPLAEPWREFIPEIEGPGYRSFIRRIFGLPATKSLILTLEWYYAWQGCGVSPHCNARRKLATHIFYFNTEADWDATWGGNILIMDDDGRLPTHSAPSFDELRSCRLARSSRKRQPALRARQILARMRTAGVAARPPAETLHRHDQRTHVASSVASDSRQKPRRLSDTPFDELGSRIGLAFGWRFPDNPPSSNMLRTHSEGPAVVNRSWNSGSAIACPEARSRFYACWGGLCASPVAATDRRRVASGSKS